MPLDVFASRTFSGVNLLTLLLYAGLGGALFFLPFDLIQVHGYSATLAGAAFLPFTAMMGALSRWSGGLLDRFGARWPADHRSGDHGGRICAPGIARDRRFLPDDVLPADGDIGVRHGGRASLRSPRPFSAPCRPTGPASHPASTMPPPRSPIFSPWRCWARSRFNAYDRELDRHLAAPTVASEVKAALQAARGKFVAEPALAPPAGRRSAGRGGDRARLARRQHRAGDVARRSARASGSALCRRSPFRPVWGDPRVNQRLAEESPRRRTTIGKYS